VDIYITVDTQKYNMPYAWDYKWNRWYGIQTPSLTVQFTVL